MALFNLENENNKHARMLNEIDKDELFKRYFIKTQSKEPQDIKEEILEIINEKDSSGEKYKLQFIASIIGVNFSYFLTHIKTKIPVFLEGTGYKINIRQVLNDLDTILKENKLITAKIIQNTNEASEDAVRIANFLVIDLMLNSLVAYLDNKNLEDLTD